MGYQRKTIMGYTIELEVFESGGCGYHKAGDRLKYPEDRGIMCPWLFDSVSSMIRILRYGGTLPWKYEGTPYEKEIDPEGITTEFVRCPDPTSSGVVLKIIRKSKEINTNFQTSHGARRPPEKHRAQRICSKEKGGLWGICLLICYRYVFVS